MIRNKNIDILKGIGILCVLLGHITSSGRLHNLIYTFHMPLFFMASGYFYRPQSTAILASKLLHTIGIPYLMFSLLNFFIQWLVSEEKNINIGQETIMFFWADGWYNNTFFFPNISPIGILWFLPALAFCRIIYNFIYQIKTIEKGVIIISLTIISILLGKYIINIPFGILEGSQALLFYWVGHQYSINQKTFINKSSSNMIKAILIIAWIIAFFFSYMSMADFSYGCWPINVLGAIGATWTLFEISSFISKHSRYITNILTWYGKHSLHILGIHVLLTTLMPYYSDRLGNLWILIFITQILTATICISIYIKIKKLLILK